MRYLSTNNLNKSYSSAEAILGGLAPDGGLFIPESIPKLNDGVLSSIASIDTNDLLVELLSLFLSDSLTRLEIDECLNAALNFPTEVVKLDENLFVLELFHGPTAAFKDYGARFMAQAFSKLHKSKQDLTVLVATSGDTGGAVASGFHNVAGIQVVILYPSGKVSPLQELQLTTWGDNITAIELAGNFDDCQALVKQAFVDPDLTRELKLTSANSINIARLLPQSLYYAIATKEIKRLNSKSRIQFTVPSGNLGNISAGVLASRCGLPIDGFFCAVNSNRCTADYLNGESYSPLPSVSTLSNAMDVGDPSNFLRLFNFAGGEDDVVRNLISGDSFSDEQTLEMMREVYSRYSYLCDPHTAVGFLGELQNRKLHPNSAQVVVSTAHPAKFLETVTATNLPTPEIPPQLAVLEGRQKIAQPMANSFSGLKEYLLSNFV